MMKTLTVLILIILGVLVFSLFSDNNQPLKQSWVGNVKTETLPASSPKVNYKQPELKYEIPMMSHVFQSFNNCGPASLSMLLSYFGVNKTQQELGQELRPYQIASGDNDDKSVTVKELDKYSQNLGFNTYYRPNGSIQLLKTLIANDIPVLVRTWLHPDEDIGHYRIVRGFDDTNFEIIQDDSYEGKNLRYNYDVFEKMWQPFNYEYLVIVPSDKKDLAEAIINQDIDKNSAWENALNKAIEEGKKDPNNPYPIFNQSLALYNLGQFEKSIEKYEQIKDRLPARMLWYQIEPIDAYFKVGNYSKVFELSDGILNNQNRAFSELYIIRGNSYKSQGMINEAKNEYEKAVIYNQNLEEAKLALEQIN